MKKRHLIIVLGDQLSARTRAFHDFDPRRDCVWMAEASEESTHVWSSKLRIALFLSSMRHFAAELEEQGIPLSYTSLDASTRPSSLGEALNDFLSKNTFERAILTWPGELRVLEEIRSVCESRKLELIELDDDSFYITPIDFAKYAQGKKQLRMEFFYREMRRRHGVLMDAGKPAGGKWNFDASNRKAFGKDGPEGLSRPLRFEPDEITRDVIKIVNTRFSDHPGSLDHFDWPVTRKQAQQALRHFIDHQLPHFGTYQDAMWTNEPFLSHALLSSSLNLKLIDPSEVVDAAEAAYREGLVPIESAEGFIRQILGWREYVRGVYWLHMPNYMEKNELQATAPLPNCYWDGDTDLNCIRQVVSQTLERGYAHHIQRLMVTGLYALLLGVDPKQIHEWYLAVYVDAVEWVELPNTLGMSQFADGGIMASKPYAATGKYIKRMSNYCDGCRYDPQSRSGENACPFTVLYWDFLYRNRKRIDENPRMRMQLNNLKRISPEEMEKIRATASTIKQRNESCANCDL